VHSQWNQLTTADDALAQQAFLTSSFTKPRSTDLGSLREWLNRTMYGDSFLAGRTEDVWDLEKGFDDFTAIRGTPDKYNELTYYVSYLILYLKRLFVSGKKPEAPIYGLNGSFQVKIADGLVTVVASICPVLPIVILFLIHSLLVRLVMILVFTAVFALILVFGMYMKSDKVLAVTTA
jgi:hypothetical protein